MRRVPTPALIRERRDAGAAVPTRGTARPAGRGLDSPPCPAPPSRPAPPLSRSWWSPAWSPAPATAGPPRPRRRSRPARRCAAAPGQRDPQGLRLRPRDRRPRPRRDDHPERRQRWPGRPRARARPAGRAGRLGGGRGAGGEPAARPDAGRVRPAGARRAARGGPLRARRRPSPTPFPRTPPNSSCSAATSPTTGSGAWRAPCASSGREACRSRSPPSRRRRRSRTSRRRGRGRRWRGPSAPPLREAWQVVPSAPRAASPAARGSVRPRGRDDLVRRISRHDLRDRRAVRRHDGPGVRGGLPRRLHPLRAGRRPDALHRSRTSASTAAPASRSARSARSSRRSRCRPSGPSTRRSTRCGSPTRTPRAPWSRRSSPPDRASAPGPGAAACASSRRPAPVAGGRSFRLRRRSSPADAHRLAPPGRHRDRLGPRARGRPRRRSRTPATTRRAWPAVPSSRGRRTRSPAPRRTGSTTSRREPRRDPAPRWSTSTGPCSPRLRPDLVLAGPWAGAAAADLGRLLRDAVGPDASVVTLEPTSLEGIFHAIATVGAMTDAEDEAVGLVEILRERLADVEEVVEERRDGGHHAPRVVGARLARPALRRRPVGAGAGPAGRRLGGPGRRRRAQPPDDVGRRRRRRPGDAAAASRAACTLPRRSGRGARRREPARWDELQAVRRGQVFALDGSAYFSRPGPRVIDGIELLAEIFDPAAFVDLAPAGSWVPVA